MRRRSIHKFGCLCACLDRLIDLFFLSLSSFIPFLVLFSSFLFFSPSLFFSLFLSSVSLLLVFLPLLIFSSAFLHFPLSTLCSCPVLSLPPCTRIRHQYSLHFPFLYSYLFLHPPLLCFSAFILQEAKAQFLLLPFSFILNSSPSLPPSFSLLSFPSSQFPFFLAFFSHLSLP